MIGTVFIEEVLFRGFLFQGIRNKSGINRAIGISGITYGLGHIVNLVRGYGFAGLAGQIIVAVAVGILLALLVAVTRNLVSGIVFHIVFNIGGSIATQGSGAHSVALIVILAVSIPYALCLYKIVRRENKIVLYLRF